MLLGFWVAPRHYCVYNSISSSVQLLLFGHQPLAENEVCSLGQKIPPSKNIAFFRYFLLFNNYLLNLEKKEEENKKGKKR